ncbi:unnamed protein product, partial [Adineta steineri]
MYTPKYDLSRLGVVSVIFNPVRYRSRYEQYYKFRNHMAHSGINLFTVECVFDSATRFGLPPQRFEVTQADNPRHIQVVAPSIMWMKENLINIAVQQLPPTIDRNAWIDADVEFEHLNWPHLTMKALDRYPIVQMFKIGYFTGPSGKQEILRRDHSFGYSIRHNKPIYPHHSQWYAHPGYAWAMHRDTFNAIGGLIDFCIVGSGDLHLAYALLGRVEETFPSGLHRDYRMQVSNWGDGVARAAGNGAFVGYVDVNLYHRWHGSRTNRNYINRCMSENSNTSDNSGSLNSQEFSRINYSILQIGQVLSLPVYLFVFFHILTNKVQRKSLHNHVILVLLLFNFLQILFDVSLLLIWLHRGIVKPAIPATCYFWNFIDYWAYYTSFLVMLWAALE